MSIWRDKDGYYHVEVQRGGKRHHRRLPKNATASDAKRLQAELRLAEPIVAGGLTEALSMQEAVMKARSTRPDLHSLYRIVPWCEGKTLADAPAVAQAFVRDCAGEYAPASINRSLAALKRACKLAWMAGLHPHNMGDRITLLPERNERHEYLTLADVERICKLEPAIADAVRISVYTGLRLGELLALGPRSVRDDMLVTDAKTKTGKARSIPIAEPIRETVQRLPIVLARRTLQTHFKAAVEAIGRTGVRWHDLRHSTASLLAQAGVSIQVIGQILGHSSIQTTMRYAHLIEDSKRDAIRRLG